MNIMHSFEDPTPLERDIGELLERFLQAECNFDYIRKRCADGWHEDVEFVRALNALGVRELFADEAEAGLPELSRIAELGGKFLLPEPLTEHILCGPILMREMTSNKVALPTLQGAGVCAMADNTIQRSDGKLNGILAHVFFGKGADYYVICLPDGSACVVESPPSDCILAYSTGLDLTRPLASVRLERLPFFTIEQSGARAIRVAKSLLDVSELVGILGAVLEQTREYVVTRTQFSRPIGSFQAVQHAVADMQVHYAAAKSLLAFVRWSVRAAPLQTELALDSLAIFLKRYGASHIQKAIQLFGGIGFTWEAPLHYYLRRARSIMAMAESTECASARLIEAAEATAAC